MGQAFYLVFRESLYDKSQGEDWDYNMDDGIALE
jgi:hypothetical protein